MDMSNEDSFDSHDGLIDFILSEMVEKLVVGSLSTVKNKGIILIHFHIDTANIPIFAGFH